MCKYSKAESRIVISRLEVNQKIQIDPAEIKVGIFTYEYQPAKAIRKLSFVCFTT